MDSRERSSALDDAAFLDELRWLRSTFESAVLTLFDLNFEGSGQGDMALVTIAAVLAEEGALAPEALTFSARSALSDTEEAFARWGRTLGIVREVWPRLGRGAFRLRFRGAELIVSARGLERVRGLAVLTAEDAEEVFDRVRHYGLACVS